MLNGLLFGYAVGSRIADSVENVPSAPVARSNAGAAHELEQRLGRLSLVCQAMWELLQERTGLTEEDLLSKVREVDLRDGEADGRVTRRIAECPSCGRTMSTRHGRCLYCGAADLRHTAFDTTQ